MHLPLGYNEQLITPHKRRDMAAHWSFVADHHGSSIILPDGCCDIILRFTINEQQTPTHFTPIITGPATMPYPVTYAPGDGWAGLRVYPANARALWGDRLKSAQDHMLLGEDALAHMPELAALIKNITPTTSVHRALQSLPALQEHDAEQHSIHQIISLIHLAGGRVSINQIADATHHSARHILRMFRNMVGLPVKKYARIVQFQRALKLLSDNKLASADVAFEAGYADQAHMIRAFKSFGGFSPANIPANLHLPGLPVI